jgi:hypothetical protein
MVEQSSFSAPDVVMTEPHDPFSQSVIANDFGFMQTLACH